MNKFIGVMLALSAMVNAIMIVAKSNAGMVMPMADYTMWIVLSVFALWGSWQLIHAD